MVQTTPNTGDISSFTLHIHPIMIFLRYFPIAVARCTKLITPTSLGFILLTQWPVMASKSIVFSPSSILRMLTVSQSNTIF